MKPPSTINQPTNRTERERILKTGTTIVGGYVKNQSGKGLAVARTIGDLSFKKDAPNAVISEPEMKSVQLQVGDYVVIACDGLWDALSNEYVAQYIAKNKQLPQIDDSTLVTEKFINRTWEKIKDPASSEGELKLLAQSLRDKAFKHGSKDNISVIIVKI